MKRIALVFLLTLIVIVPISGCKKNVGAEYSRYSYYEDENETGTGKDNETGTGNDNETGTGNDNETGAGNAGGSGYRTGNGKNNNSGSVKNQNTDASGTASQGTVGKAYNLGGKTYTMAITISEGQYHTTSFKAMISAFEKKYNCKIKTESLEFGKYNQQVSQRMSSGDPYDICYIHGSMFPSGPISGIYADLTATKKAINPQNLSEEKSNLFSWNGALYGLCDDTACFPVIMYYNKVMFESAGLEDPRSLYNNGKWTWDKIFELGSKVVDKNAGTYFLGSQFIQTNLYGESSIYIENGKVINNLMSDKILRSLQLIQRIYAGNDAIGSGLTSQDYQAIFANGRVYAVTEESSKYSEIAELVKKSMAFNKSIDNIGIVPVPLPPENTQKLYPTGWYTAIAAGAGSDAKVAVLWAEFCSTFMSPVRGKNEMTETDQALISKLLKGPTLPNRHGSYSTSNTSTLDIYDNMIIAVKKGNNIAKVLGDYNSQYTACIEATVGKNNYISK